MPDPLTSLLTGDLVDRLRQLELFSRLRVEGTRTGDNPSPLKGFSSDFLQHRQYFPGDSLRYLDWRVLAKSERLVIKQYEELTNARLHVVVDCSASMAFSGVSFSKLEYSIRCAACLFYIMLLQQDTFGLAMFSDHLVARVPTGSSRRHLRRVFERLVSAEPRGETDFEACFRSLEPLLSRRGIVVVFSDFMDDPRRLGTAMGRLRLRGQDVIAFQVSDPGERELEYVDFTRFRDFETGEVLGADPLTIGREYTRQFDLHQRALREQCLAHGLDFCPLTVSDDYETSMGDYLRHRMQLML